MSNLNEKITLIWSIADKLRGVYQRHEYGKIILPFIVLRRFDCILEKTKDATLMTQKENIAQNFPKDLQTIYLTNASGYDFYNISKFDFKKLLDDPDNIESNLKEYILGFSQNVIDILEKFKIQSLAISKLTPKSLPILRNPLPSL